MADSVPMPTAIGPYRILGFLGAGGMGTVWKAQHRVLGRDVAIKRLSDAASAGVPFERFRNEARLHGALNHPRIAQLYDFLDDGGVPCIVMEYIDGPTIEALLKSGRLPVGTVLSIMTSLADTVGYLHRRGILHRDIKASNVKLRPDGSPVLLDFGIARADGDPRLTRTGMIIGSPQAIPPEQFDGLAMDARGDVWALGVLLYEMLTGRPPFAGDSIAALATAVTFGTPPAPSALVPSVPVRLDAVVARCLERERERRYPSADALREALRAVLTRGAVTGHFSEGVGASWQRWRAAGVHRVTALSALVVASAVLGGAALWHQSTPVVSTVPSVPAVRVHGAVDAGTLSSDVTPAVAPAPAPRAVVTRISIVEGSADVLIDGRVVGATPYRHFAPVGTSVSLTLRRTGFLDEAVTFIVSDNQREYTLVLQRDPSIPASPALLGLVAWWRRRRTLPVAPERRADADVTGERVIIEALEFRSAALTDVGCVRSGNEDAVQVVHLPDGAVVAVLCDGMGGHAAGEVAADLAVTTIVERAATLETSAAMVATIDAANSRIRTAMHADAALTGMGTTCVVLRLHGQSALCAHVGDSRAYLMRDGAIYRLTEDHSQVRHLVRDGQLAEQDARHHPDKNVILRALGPARRVEASTWPTPLGLRAGDRFLLSSDGLHDLADDDEFLPALVAAAPQQACAALVALARERGAPDNVSVCIVDVARRSDDLRVTRTAGVPA